MCNGLQAIMKELDNFFKQYQSLEPTRTPIDQFKMGTGGFSGAEKQNSVKFYLAFCLQWDPCEVCSFAPYIYSLNLTKYLGYILPAS